MRPETHFAVLIFRRFDSDPSLPPGRALARLRFLESTHVPHELGGRHNEVHSQMSRSSRAILTATLGYLRILIRLASGVVKEILNWAAHPACLHPRIVYGTAVLCAGSSVSVSALHETRGVTLHVSTTSLWTPSTLHSKFPFHRLTQACGGSTKRCAGEVRSDPHRATNRFLGRVVIV